jgi:hypothetical protein
MLSFLLVFGFLEPRLFALAIRTVLHINDPEFDLVELVMRIIYPIHRALPCARLHSQNATWNFDSGLHLNNFVFREMNGCNWQSK